VILKLSYQPDPNGYPECGWDTGWLKITVVELKILYPCDANGNGKIDDPTNEFVFTADDPGVLEITCTAVYSPGVDPTKYRWLIEDIGNLKGIWNPHLPGNKYIGIGISSTVTFTGMPVSNSGFGPKSIYLSYEGLPCADQEKIEVFFPPFATNHPGDDSWNEIPDSIDEDDVVLGR